MSLRGIGLAWHCIWVRRPGTTAQPRRRASAALHDFLAHKWYFDELYDRTIVRPTLAFAACGVGGPSSAYVIDGIVDGHRRSRCAPGSPLVRVAQSGLLRYYALLLMIGRHGARPLLPAW